MQSKLLFYSTLCAVAVNSQSTSTDEPLIDAGDIENVIPTQYLAASEATSIAAVADSFIASVTAAPEFTSVVSVLATGIPITAQQAIESDPEAFLLNIVRGSPLPSWATALPPSVSQYIESVAQDAANIVTSDFADLYTSVSSEVAALETGAAASGAFVYPTGGYGGKSNYTAPRPTGSAAAPGSTPQSFPGGASGATSLRIGGLATGLVAAATTLQPVFDFPFDGTSTTYQSTTTVKSFLDCSGSSLVVSTFSAVLATNSAIAATVTSPLTTSSEFACLPSTSSSGPSFTETFPTLPPPTAVPPPPIDPTAQILIDEIRTAILYASLIANGGNEANICSAINPSSLSNNTGLNGTIVQSETCAAASLQQYLPGIAPAVILENQAGLSYLSTALFAVQVISGFAGGTNRTTLCNEIDEDFINRLLIGYVEGTGSTIKHTVFYYSFLSNDHYIQPLHSAYTLNSNRLSIGNFLRLPIVKTLSIKIFSEIISFVVSTVKNFFNPPNCHTDPGPSLGSTPTASRYLSSIDTTMSPLWLLSTVVTVILALAWLCSLLPIVPTIQRFVTSIYIRGDQHMRALRLHCPDQDEVIIKKNWIIWDLETKLQQQKKEKKAEIKAQVAKKAQEIARLQEINRDVREVVSMKSAEIEALKFRLQARKKPAKATNLRTYTSQKEHLERVRKQHADEVTDMALQYNVKFANLQATLEAQYDERLAASIVQIERDVELAVKHKLEAADDALSIDQELKTHIRILESSDARHAVEMRKLRKEFNLRVKMAETSTTKVDASKYSDLQHQYNTQKTELQQLEEDLKRSESRNRNLQGRIDKDMVPKRVVLGLEAKIHELEQAMALKDCLLNSERAAGSAREKDLRDTIEANITIYRDNVALRDEQIRENNRVYNVEIKVRDSKITQLGLEVADKDAQIKHCYSKIEQLVRDATINRAQIETFDFKIAQLSQEVETKGGQLDAHNSQLAQLNQEVKDRDAQINARDSEIEKLVQEVRDKDTRLAELQARLSALEATPLTSEELSAVKESTQCPQVPPQALALVDRPANAEDLMDTQPLTAEPDQQSVSSGPTVQDLQPFSSSPLRTDDMAVDLTVLLHQDECSGETTPRSINDFLESSFPKELMKQPVDSVDQSNQLLHGPRNDFDDFATWPEVDMNINLDDIFDPQFFQDASNLFSDPHYLDSIAPPSTIVDDSPQGTQKRERNDEDMTESPVDASRMPATADIPIDPALFDNPLPSRSNGKLDQERSQAPDSGTAELEPPVGPRKKFTLRSRRPRPAGYKPFQVDDNSQWDPPMPKTVIEEPLPLIVDIIGTDDHVHNNKGSLCPEPLQPASSPPSTSTYSEPPQPPQSAMPSPPSSPSQSLPGLGDHNALPSRTAEGQAFQDPTLFAPQPEHNSYAERAKAERIIADEEDDEDEGVPWEDVPYATSIPQLPITDNDNGAVPNPDDIDAGNDDFYGHEEHHTPSPQSSSQARAPLPGINVSGKGKKRAVSDDEVTFSFPSSGSSQDVLSRPEPARIGIDTAPSNNTDGVSIPYPTGGDDSDNLSEEEKAHLDAAWREDMGTHYQYLQVGGECDNDLLEKPDNIMATVEVLRFKSLFHPTEGLFRLLSLAWKNENVTAVTKAHPGWARITPPPVCVPDTTLAIPTRTLQTVSASTGADDAFLVTVILAFFLLMLLALCYCRYYRRRHRPIPTPIPAPTSVPAPVAIIGGSNPVAMTPSSRNAMVLYVPRRSTWVHLPAIGDYITVWSLFIIFLVFFASTTRETAVGIALPVAKAIIAVDKTASMMLMLGHAFHHRHSVFCFFQRILGYVWSVFERLGAWFPGYAIIRYIDIRVRYTRCYLWRDIPMIFKNRIQDPVIDVIVSLGSIVVTCAATVWPFIKLLILIIFWLLIQPVAAFSWRVFTACLGEALDILYKKRAQYVTGPEEQNQALEAEKARLIAQLESQSQSEERRQQEFEDGHKERVKHRYYKLHNEQEASWKHVCDHQRRVSKVELVAREKSTIKYNDDLHLPLHMRDWKRIESLESSNKKHERRHAKDETTRKQLEATIRSLEAIKGNADPNRSPVQDQTSQIESLNSQLADKTARYDLCEAELREVRSQFEATKSRLNATQAQVATSAVQVKVVMEQLNKANAENKALQQTSVAQTQKLSAEISTLRSQFQVTESNLKTAKTQLANSAAQAKPPAEQLAKANAENKALRRTNAAQAQQLSTQEGEMSTLLSQLQVMDSNLTATRTQVANSAAQVNAVTEQLTHASSENKALQQTNEAQAQKLSTQEVEMSTLTQTMTRLQAEIKPLTDKLMGNISQAQDATSKAQPSQNPFGQRRANKHAPLPAFTTNAPMPQFTFNPGPMNIDPIPDPKPNPNASTNAPIFTNVPTFAKPKGQRLKLSQPKPPNPVTGTNLNVMDTEPDKRPASSLDDMDTDDDMGIANAGAGGGGNAAPMDGGDNQTSRINNAANVTSHPVPKEDKPSNIIWGLGTSSHNATNEFPTSLAISFSNSETPYVFNSNTYTTPVPPSVPEKPQTVNPSPAAGSSDVPNQPPPDGPGNAPEDGQVQGSNPRPKPYMTPKQSLEEDCPYGYETFPIESTLYQSGFVALSESMRLQFAGAVGPEVFQDIYESERKSTHRGNLSGREMDWIVSDFGQALDFRQNYRFGGLIHVIGEAEPLLDIYSTEGGLVWVAKKYHAGASPEEIRNTPWMAVRIKPGPNGEGNEPANGDTTSEDPEVEEAKLQEARVQEAKTLEARVQEGQQAHRAAFPYGIDRLVTPPDSRCGLDAVIRTISAMHTELTPPTHKEFSAIYNSSDFLAAGEDPLTHFFDVGQVAEVLRRWGMQRSMAIQLGYLEVVRGEVQKKVLVPDPNEENPNKRIVWIHHNAQPPPMTHLSGLRAAELLTSSEESEAE
ncbi:MAG: hypothetical protein Q9170_005808 [Blastenia crenularia]